MCCGLFLEASFQDKWLHNQLYSLDNFLLATEHNRLDQGEDSKKEISHDLKEIKRDRKLLVKGQWVNSTGKTLRDHVFHSHLCSQRTGGLRDHPVHDCTPAPLRCDRGVGSEADEVGEGHGGGGVSSDYSNYSSRICHSQSHLSPDPYLSGDRQGGDPDLPVSTDCGHYRERALQPIRGYAGLLGRKTKSPSHYFLLTMIPMAWRRKWRQ